MSTNDMKAHPNRFTGSSVRKRLLVAVVMTIAVGGAVISPASAQWAVVDLPQTLQVILADIKRAADMAKQYGLQTQQLATQLKQWQDMVNNSVRLTDSQWASVSRDINRFRDVYRQTRSLAGDVKDLDRQFKNTFKDYKSFSSGKRGKSFEEEYANWADNGFDNARTAMKAAGMQVDMMADEDAVLADLVAQSKSASGRMEALQVANEMAAQQVQQTQKLRQLMTAQINMQAQALAQATQRQAAEDANTNRYFNEPKVSKGKEF